MKCPYCGAVDSKVIDSRPTEDGEKIRRRRECLNCKKRFTTYEIVETVPLMVVKKDHSREVFDRQKLLNGMLRACEKRPVSYQQLDDAVSLRYGRQPRRPGGGNRPGLHPAAADPAIIFQPVLSGCPA